MCLRTACVVFVSLSAVLSNVVQEFAILDVSESGSTLEMKYLTTLHAGKVIWQVTRYSLSHCVYVCASHMHEWKKIASTNLTKSKKLVSEWLVVG